MGSCLRRNDGKSAGRGLTRIAASTWWSSFRVGETGLEGRIYRGLGPAYAGVTGGGVNGGEKGLELEVSVFRLLPACYSCFPAQSVAGPISGWTRSPLDAGYRFAPVQQSPHSPNTKSHSQDPAGGGASLRDRQSGADRRQLLQFGFANLVSLPLSDVNQHAAVTQPLGGDTYGFFVSRAGHSAVPRPNSSAKPNLARLTKKLYPQFMQLRTAKGKNLPRGW